MPSPNLSVGDKYVRLIIGSPSWNSISAAIFSFGTYYVGSKFVMTNVMLA